MKDEELEESEDLEDSDDEEAEGEEEEGSSTPAASTDTDGDGEVESSLEELIAKKEDRKPAEEEEEDDSSAALTPERDERLEPLAVKVVPMQPTEFVCKKCHLVKHRSQLKDRSRGLCRDCA